MNDVNTFLQPILVTGAAGFLGSHMAALGITLAFFILNCLIDKNENIEQEVADYLKENSLQKVDFLEHQRIKYYVNYNIHDLLQNDTNQSSSLYELHKIDIIKRLDEKFIIKKFPEMKPKFILIKHAQ